MTKLKWCARIISPHGVRYNPYDASGLQNCASPMNACGFCEYICSIGGMRSQNSDHAGRVAPLHGLLELAFKRTGKRTKRSIKSTPLFTICWNIAQKTCFRDLQSTLSAQLHLDHQSKSLQLCIFTDASDRFWASVVTQCETNELNKSIKNQSHQPLAFLSGEFTGTELGWTTVEKKGYAISQVFTRLNYMLQCESPIRIFTDHRNIFLFLCPLLLDLSMGRNKVLEVLHWAHFLAQFLF